MWFVYFAVAILVLNNFHRTLRQCIEKGLAVLLGENAIVHHSVLLSTETCRRPSWVSFSRNVSREMPSQRAALA